MERLSKNVLLCLFAGEVTSIDIHQKPESLHFGFDRPDSKEGNYCKEGKETPIVSKDPRKRVVDIEKLAADFGSVHSAQFAVNMIEGVESVRFQVSSPGRGSSA